MGRGTRNAPANLKAAFSSSNAASDASSRWPNSWTRLRRCRSPVRSLLTTITGTVSLAHSVSASVVRTWCDGWSVGGGRMRTNSSHYSGGGVRGEGAVSGSPLSRLPGEGGLGGVRALPARCRGRPQGSPLQWSVVRTWRDGVVSGAFPISEIREIRGFSPSARSNLAGLASVL